MLKTPHQKILGSLKSQRLFTLKKSSIIYIFLNEKN